MSIFMIFIMLPALILLLLAIIAVVVLLIKSCSKRPWIAAIIALLFLPLLAFVFWHVSYQGLEADRTFIYSEPERISNEFEENVASIWLPGIEDEFEADIYASKLSAVRALGLRIDEPVKDVFGESSPSRIILFKGAHDRILIEEFNKAVADAFPDVNRTIASETAAVKPDEVGIRLDIVKVQTRPAAWLNGPEQEMTTGTIQASVLAGDRQASVSAEFVDKHWIENLARFLTANRMDGIFIVAKSTDSCMTEAEANNQALRNARDQVADILGRSFRERSGIPVSFAGPVSSTDIIEGDFILDRFVQSFQGTSGKIWRQALLLDVSPTKLKNLAERKAVVATVRKRHFSRMFFSVIGLIVLITIVYAFLNAATKGYYAWSLRIAGVVFALVVIILLLV